MPSSPSPASGWSLAGQGLNAGLLIGDLLTLGRSLCLGHLLSLGSRILRRYSPLVATTWAVVAGTLFIAPVGIAQLVTDGVSGGLTGSGRP